MMQGKFPLKQSILIDRGVGQRYGKHRESMGTCSATCGELHDFWGGAKGGPARESMGTCSAMCGELHDLWGGAKGGQAEGGGGYTCSRQVQQEALDGLGVQ